MKVLLAGPDFEENLSIRYLSSSLLAAGHETVLAAFNSPSDLEAVAEQAQDAAIVGLSMCFQSRAKEFLHLARVIKSRDPQKLIVAGGHYASCAAEPLLANHPEIDVVVIHEGEKTLVEIAEAIADNQGFTHIPGIGYRDRIGVQFTAQRPTLDELDTLPFPDRRGPIHSIAGVPTSYVMGSRGCYGSCAYCCITTLHQLAPGKRFRQRSVAHIADEMAALYHERGTRQFVFHDDNFLVPSEAINHARISGLDKALKSRGVDKIALVIKCRPADANRNVLRRLKGLGLVRVFMGIEAATERGLASLERWQSVEDSVRALETCLQLDISAQFTLMTFNPDATLETLRSDVAFMRRFSANPLNFCRAEIYAGTPLEKRMIALGRARGDYLAREYELADPIADLACTLSLDLFYSRCWTGGSLMQRAIGLDHSAAVVKRFYDGPQHMALCQSVSGWLRCVNLDTINLLDEVIELSARSRENRDTAFRRAVAEIRERESVTREMLLAEGSRLKAAIESFQSVETASQFNPLSGSRFRLARQVAAALLAVGLPATSACAQTQDKDKPTSAPAKDGQYYGISEMAAPPLETQPPVPAPHSGSLSGTISDSKGAVINRAKITITNLDTGEIRRVESNQAGQYKADDLPAGRYEIKAEAQYFKTSILTGIALKVGESHQADIRLEIGNLGNYGCCEYAAVPLRAPDYLNKKKPFTYLVGEANDDGTLQAIAKLVYGNPKMWVQIFEANRDVIDKPGVLPYGKSIVIPPRRRQVPKPISKALPIYPAQARKQGVSGDVIMDVTLKDDGAVDQVDVIDGNSLLSESAISAVKQWRYQPLMVKGKPVLKFVVVISFGKGGKVQ